MKSDILLRYLTEHSGGQKSTSSSATVVKNSKTLVKMEIPHRIY